ncbi:heterokaryon incompatibility protein-domain-containing protein [Podospora aff. communis PSN243]|uniref:Heterokaryon incompatibility protein-domain-containing protein n=1 Tax=Podospora aff. communis PSN243 TaxID=3040156 RepID=A0AAV9GQ96_9PEZI|nr:heterokaryon incompatibility protein-domain-containing protein [Podospora aff. communis PSN243]
MGNETRVLAVRPFVPSKTSMHIRRRSKSCAKPKRRKRCSKVTSCRLCATLMRLAKKPLEHQQYRTPSVKAKDLQRSPCKAHAAIVAKCQAIVGDYDGWTIKLEKAGLQRTVQVGPNDVYGFRLAMLPSSRHSTNPQYCGRRVHAKWIDMDTVRNWRTICDRNHPECRHRSVADHVRSPSEGPALLIDTKLMCICEATSKQVYLALSYVWGGSTQLKLSTTNLSDLMRERSLSKPQYSTKIPRTIRDAIGLVQALGERYLWVDALCIVQDDEVHTRVQLQAMASIYGNATLTIVAAQGCSADHGLHGIPGVSKPRSFHQEFFGTASGRTFVHCPDLWAPHSHWIRRGWTHQESLFSVRKLMFVGNSIEWQCHYAIFREDIKDEDVKIPIAEQRIHGFRQERSQQCLLHPRLPDFEALESVINQYLSRDFTYPMDVLPAFAGLEFVLSKVFDGGFLFGMPEMCFDAALLWAVRRTNYEPRDDGDTASTLTVPSWSWMGWTGIDGFAWYDAFDHIKWALEGYWSSVRTLPLVEWYSGSGLTSKPRVILNHWRKYAGIGSRNLPPGWTAHKHTPIKIKGKYVVENTHRQPKHFYTHESDPKMEFWYPLPLVDPDLASQPNPHDPPSPFISCSTNRAFMTLGERFKPHRSFPSVVNVSVHDNSGTWAGSLHINSMEDIALGPARTNDDPPATPCELAAISTGWAYNDSHEGLMEWSHPDRPREGEKYEWYNVMWIQWHGEVARRKGIGRICKEVWEAQELERIHLVLN